MLHADFGEMKSPKKLEEQINDIEGVLENGLFAIWSADVVIFGRQNGSVKTLGL